MYREIAMWYIIIGLVMWAIGLYRELTKKSAGPADPLVVLCLIMFWLPFLIWLLIKAVLTPFSQK